jgi:hypothetical protein
MDDTKAELELEAIEELEDADEKMIRTARIVRVQISVSNDW